MTVRWPGLIDVHTHLRDPGATWKEDFIHASRAALSGGFTYILDMPNNPVPTFSRDALDDKIKRSRNLGCEIGFHFGTDGKNLQQFSLVWNDPHVFGLKLYCNHTTGNFLMDDPVIIEKAMRAWKSEKPILLHAEGEILGQVLQIAYTLKKRIHVCHVSVKKDILTILLFKNKGMSLTCGVCPHHLYFTKEDEKILGSYVLMKPYLGNLDDQDALWSAIIDRTIDIVESDHAPHTIEEKKSSTPPFGVPGLETSLGLMLLAVHQKRLTEEDIKRLMYTNPKLIFHIPDQDETFLEFDPVKPWVVRNSDLQTKCRWSPFDGRQLFGKVERTVVNGTEVYKNGILK